jgi:hypothetical protein
VLRAGIAAIGLDASQMALAGEPAMILIGAGLFRKSLKRWILALMRAVVMMES